MSTYQQTLTGDAAESGHLQRVRPENIPSDLEADPARSEWWCKDCGHRVTVTDEDVEHPEARTDMEFGHARDCKHHCYNGGIAE